MIYFDKEFFFLSNRLREPKRRALGAMRLGNALSLFEKLRTMDELTAQARENEVVSVYIVLV